MLWLRVLEQCWRDADELANDDVYKARDAAAAIEWVWFDSDFEEVCALADVDYLTFRTRFNQKVTGRYQKQLLLQVFARHYQTGAKQRKPKGD